jgi:hypothetical protein
VTVASGALLGRAAARNQVVRGVDQGDVRKALREVAELMPRAPVVLPVEQAQIVAKRKEKL